MEECIRVDDHRTCCYFFDGECGGYAVYPSDYQGVKVPFKCVLEIQDEKASIEKKKTMVKQRYKPMF